MAVDERARHQLHTRLEETLGAESAITLMSYLPPVGWAEVATKRDLDQLSDRFDAALHRELGAFRADVGTRFDSLRSELHHEVGSVRSDVGGQVESLRGEVGSLRGEFAAQTRTLLLGTGALMVSIATLAFAAFQLT